MPVRKLLALSPGGEVTIHMEGHPSSCVTANSVITVLSVQRVPTQQKAVCSIRCHCG